MRVLAIQALVAVGKKEAAGAVPALVKALKAEDHRARAAAATALAEFGPRKRAGRPCSRP